MTESIAEAQLLAARLAASADIRDVRLLSTNAKINRLPGPDPRLTYRLLQEPEIEYDEDSFIVKVAYELDIAEMDPEAHANSDSDPFDDESAIIARIAFELAALFLLDMHEDDEPPSVEEMQAYAATTGQFALYPFAREYVYDVTGRLALPALTLAVLRLPARRD